MHRIGTGAPRGDDQFVDIEVSLGRSAPTQRDGGIGLAHEGGLRIAVGIDGHGGDAHRVRGALDAARDLASIGDQQPADGLDAH